MCCAAETVSTLKFAHRAKSVRNMAHVNEDADQRTLLRKYEQELRKLRAELQMRQREVVDKRHLLAVRLSLQTVLSCEQRALQLTDRCRCTQCGILGRQPLLKPCCVSIL